MNYKVTKRLEELYKETAYIDLEKGSIDFNAACLIAAGKCERIAIEFAKYIKEDDDIEYIGYNKYRIMVEAEGECFPITIPEEEVFENFINEYYEKID